MICGVSCLPAGAMCETLVDPKGSRCPTRGVSFLAYRKANPSFSSSPSPQLAVSFSLCTLHPGFLY